MSSETRMKKQSTLAVVSSAFRQFRLRIGFAWFGGVIAVLLVAGIRRWVFWDLTQAELTDAEMSRALLMWRQIPLFVLTVWATVAGAFIPIRFFPAGQYAAWLQRPPWTPEKPLPFGPVHPDVFDAVGLSIIVLFTWMMAQADLIWVPIAGFLAGYSVAAASCVSADPASAVTCFCLPLLRVTWSQPIAT